jgi:hypothetical protein
MGMKQVVILTLSLSGTSRSARVVAARKTRGLYSTGSGHGLAQPLFKRDFGLPMQEGLGPRHIRLALHGIICRQRLVDHLGTRPGHGQDLLSQHPTGIDRPSDVSGGGIPAALR